MIIIFDFQLAAAYMFQAKIHSSGWSMIQFQAYTTNYECVAITTVKQYIRVVYC